jgi:hypothetical protein
MRNSAVFCVVALFLGFGGLVNADALDNYNVVWNSASKDSSESMPVGGGDIGLNVWVENGEVLFYMARSGTFDENNEFLKLGRVRMKLSPNPFGEQSEFRQELKLRQGYIEITGKNRDKGSATVKVWVEVYRPVIHVDISGDQPFSVEAAYEGWRTKERELPDDGKDSRFGCFGYDAYLGKVYTYPDTYELLRLRCISGQGLHLSGYLRAYRQGGFVVPPQSK